MQDNMSDKDLYTIAVLRYKEENSNVDFDNLFSADFNLCKDYKLKICIIAEALQKNIKIDETDLYKKCLVKK